jgi:phospholipase/carboxylesterase
MDLVHAVWEPEGDGPFPTLFALHGFGSHAFDLLGLAPGLLGGSLLVIAPQGPLRIPLGPGAYGYAWFPISGGGPLDLAAFDAGRKALDEFMEQARQRYPIDPSRQLVLGFSQGGVMAFDQALRQPDRFAGLMALSSWLPAELARTYLALPAHQLLPTLVQHGTSDDLVPLERATQSLRLLRELGIPVTFSEYEMGHEVSQESLADLNRWLGGEALG